jgi:hypothetical protein
MLKVTTWSLLLAGLFNVAALLPQVPGLALFLGLVRPGAFTIVASSIAAAAHERKDLILGILLVTVLAAYPFGIDELARLLIPLGVGILLGGLLRSALLQEQSHGTERPTR